MLTQFVVYAVPMFKALSSDVISQALHEIRERRRLRVDNSISSFQFSTACIMSEKVLDKLFSELQTEADNSITDYEKLSKIPPVVRCCFQSLDSSQRSQSQSPQGLFHNNIVLHCRSLSAYIGPVRL